MTTQENENMCWNIPVHDTQVQYSNHSAPPNYPNMRHVCYYTSALCTATHHYRLDKNEEHVCVDILGDHNDANVEYRG